MQIDLHTHTYFSHGESSPRENVLSAIKNKVDILGFTEHSPRPEQFSYHKDYDYQEKIQSSFPKYVEEVFSLKKEYEKSQKIKILLGIEQDFFPGHEEWIRDFLSQYSFDYRIGSVHFIGTWGFDIATDLDKWNAFSREETFEKYEEYFSSVKKMAASRIFHIAAHLDLVKIFTVETFREWRKTREAQMIFTEILKAIKENGMALEISSAGYRKPCKELYPCLEILEIASELQVPIVFSSDAHSASDITDRFTDLKKTALKLGFKKQAYFEAGKMRLADV